MAACSGDDGHTKGSRWPAGHLRRPDVRAGLPTRGGRSPMRKDDDGCVVLQVGKWRRSLHVNVAGCQTNPQPDKSLTLPGTVTGFDDNMPDIAVSTGGADSLECLMLRMGIPASEYVAGARGCGTRPRVCCSAMVVERERIGSSRCAVHGAVHLPTAIQRRG
jgi:hypothetical protein